MLLHFGWRMWREGVTWKMQALVGEGGIEVQYVGGGVNRPSGFSWFGVWSNGQLLSQLLTASVV
jgi:hypothetical protein